MSELTQLINKHHNQMGVSFLVYLGWLCQCDGIIENSERSLLGQISQKILKNGEHPSVLLMAAHKASAQDLVLAATFIRKHSKPANRPQLFELAVTVALADGVFSSGENHVLRLFADVLDLTQIELDQSFLNITGRPLPEPSDVSSAYWWKQRKNEERKTTNSPLKSSVFGRNQTEALTRLGLTSEATLDEIRSAYKRLAKAHHPDRFSDLEESIVEAASESFRKIREAYELLTE